MNVETIAVGAFESNCYLVRGTTSEVLVIDPGSDAHHILEVLRKRRLTVAAYLLTHGHVDHLSAVAHAHQAMPAPVYMHAEDLRWAFGPENQLLPFYPIPLPPEVSIIPLVDGQEHSDAGLKWRAIATPGHTPGSVCILFPEAQVLFSGDTLFAGSVGRTDLPGGDSRILAASLARLTTLDDRTRVYPGHGPATDIGQEKRHNVFLRG